VTSFTLWRPGVWGRGDIQMNMKAIACAVTLSALLVGGAQASEVLITITSASGPTVAFELPRSPTPDDINTGYLFYFFDLHGTLNGAPADLGETAFYEEATQDGGLGDDYYTLSGAQYYSGTLENPTFILGNYPNQTIYRSNGSVADVDITSVPEPATWALMLVGFGGLGAAMRARRGALSTAA
jgi:hypothetical protein